MGRSVLVSTNGPVCQRVKTGPDTGTIQPVYANPAVMFRATQWRVRLRFELLQLD
jgi:hypothetical protein